MPQQLILKYGELIGDLQAFTLHSQKELPLTFWLNSSKASESQAALSKLQNHAPINKTEWASKIGFESYRACAGETSIGNTLPFFCGWIYVQEEIAQVAVKALEPKAGDMVCDFCASPGGKTAQVALAVGETGSVLAIEPNPFRLAALGNTTERLGLTNVATMQHEGQGVPGWFGPFDKVLIDAPCSSEGTIRKTGGESREGIKGFKEHLVKIQTQILKRALANLKPGGTAVYSTCTINPSENEGVLTAALGENDSIVGFQSFGLKSDPGILNWKDASFRKDCANAKRFLPHHNDTGGFFIAKIQKGDIPCQQPQSEQAAKNKIRPLHRKWIEGGWTEPERYRKNKQAFRELAEEEHLKIANWFKDFFGFPLPSNFRLFRRGGPQVYCSTLSVPSHPHIRMAGIPLAKLTERSVIPSSAGAQFFGAKASNLIQLNEADAMSFAQGQPIPLLPEHSKTFALYAHHSFVLGYGVRKEGNCLPQVPKGYRIRMK